MRKKRYTIIIFGGLLRKGSDDKYRTDQFNYIRVLAGYYLYKELSKKHKVRLIISGGKGIYEHIPGMPTVSSVMKEELIKLGLSSKEIVEENKMGSTYQELVWLKRIPKKNNKIIIISNAYHLPRIKVMIDLISKLQTLKKTLTLIPAENIVPKYNGKLKSKLKKNKKDPKMKEIIAQEKRGIKALRSGNYKLR